MRKIIGPSILPKLDVGGMVKMRLILLPLTRKETILYLVNANTGKSLLELLFFKSWSKKVHMLTGEQIIVRFGISFLVPAVLPTD